MAAGAIRVRGLRELQKACAASDRELRLGVRSKLKEAAEPVRVEAERRAPSEIRNLGPVWGRMRTGVTTSVVYVAPKARRAGGSPRSNLGGMLFRVMQGALDDKADDVQKKFEEVVDDIAARNW